MRQERQENAVDGFRLAYDRTGSAGRPAVLLLHGWPGDRTDYREVVPLLAGAGQADVVSGRGRAGRPQALGCRNKSGGSTPDHLCRIQFESKWTGNPSRGSSGQCGASDISSLAKGAYDNLWRVQFYAPIGWYPCGGVHARLDSTVNGFRGRGHDFYHGQDSIMRKAGGRLVGCFGRHDHNVRYQQLAAWKDDVDCFKHVEVATCRRCRTGEISMQPV